MSSVRSKRSDVQMVRLAWEARQVVSPRAGGVQFRNTSG